MNQAKGLHTLWTTPGQNLRETTCFLQVKKNVLCLMYKPPDIISLHLYRTLLSMLEANLAIALTKETGKLNICHTKSAWSVLPDHRCSCSCEIWRNNSSKWEAEIEQLHMSWSSPKKPVVTEFWIRNWTITKFVLIGCFIWSNGINIWFQEIQWSFSWNAIVFKNTRWRRWCCLPF